MSKIKSNLKFTITNLQFTMSSNAFASVTLTNCNYQFMPGAKVVVEPGTVSGTGNNPSILTSGGKLTLNSTTFKSVPACNAQWLGIEVSGIRTVHQATIGGKCAQGQVVANNSIISNAICAVALWEPGNYTTTGGIINATATWFTNNTKSLHALEYNNYVPSNGSVSVSNLSSFTNCTFNITSAYVAGDPAQVFVKHVDLNKVNGLKFRGCDFSIPAGANSNIGTYNMAIGCYNAGFQLDAPCTNTSVPCSNYDWGNFNNFYAAVYASSNIVNNPNTFSIVRANFTNNAIGVYVNGLKNESILFNKFYLGPNYGDNCEDGPSPSIGIDLINTTGFVVEENEFARGSAAPPFPVNDYIGIRVNHCKATTETLYKNKFTGMNRANLAVGINRKMDQYGQYPDWNGVNYMCNQNFFNAYDLHVATASSIRGKLGLPELASGNVLTTSSFNSLVKQIQNDGTEDIRYYFYYPNVPERLIKYSDYVNPMPLYNSTYQNTCPSHYGGGSGGSSDLLVLTPAAIQQKSDEFYQNQSDYNSVSALYQQLTDGGSTTGTLTDIETSQSSAMWDLRQELLQKSPYLSQEVLISASDKTEVLPEAILFEILSANPDELRRQELIDYLRNKAEPLPEYMIELLELLANGETAKTALLNQMGTYENERVQAAMSIIRSAVNDSVIDYSYIRTWLNNIGGLEAEKQVVATYIAEGNYTEAVNTLNAMPITHNLTGTELIRYNEYKELAEMLIGLDQQGNGLDSLTVEHLSLLNSFAASSEGDAKYMAQAILSQYNNTHCFECPPQPLEAGLKQSKSIDMSKLAEALGLFIQVQPNPATTWAAINYRLLPGETEGVITLTDSKGAVVKQIRLTAYQGQEILDTRAMPAGIYIYTLSSKDASQSGKLIVE